MQPTIFGVLVLGIGPLLVLFGSLEALLFFVMTMSLMGGSSAITLTALGNSSIMPANLAICFLILRFMMPGKGQYAALEAGMKANIALIVFVLYGAVGAYVLPRIFAGAMYVTPLHPNPTRDPLASEPLTFTNQNITNSVYFLETMFAALGGYIVACRRNASSAGPGFAGRLALWACGICTVHTLLGLLSVAAKDRLAPFFKFFRNGSYAQLDQQVGEYSRMNGIFPEPSNYAVYGFAWLVFVTELWLRDVRPRWTGPAAAMLAAALAASTSSTAYIGLTAYGVLLTARLVLLPGSARPSKLLLLAGTTLAGIVAVLMLAVLLPAVGAKIGQIVSGATFTKMESLSGMQRAFWAKQGIDAFRVSGGLGIGCGSFRSSSLITAILGCMGVVGIVTFLIYLAQVFMPLRRSSWNCINDVDTAVGAAASWAALLMLAPLSLTAPSPDPGILWGLFCGLARALRTPTVHKSKFSTQNDSNWHYNVTIAADHHHPVRPINKAGGFGG